MESESRPQEQLAEISQHPDLDSAQDTTRKPKIVVIMGATGAGKSKLAIDLASHFSIEIINADSMQVYEGLDVLTNKVPIHEQKGVPHHLLGTVSPNAEFTAKDFRDSAIPLIDEIWPRNCLPVIVGGTNYYIQALVSQFLLDDHAEDFEGNFLSVDHDKNCKNNVTLLLIGDDDKPDSELGFPSENCEYTYSRLQELDPIAANRIHPNDHRKIKQYLSLYSRLGVLPSKLFQDNSMQDWGQADSLRYDCCFICVDASLPALDQYVDQRVDLMINAGLLEEVRDIYKLDADYTRGLRQAIGVREFGDFLTYWKSELFKENMHEILHSSNDNPSKRMLKEAIEKVKLNTRRLVRRQRRRLNRLQLLFGWDIHFLDVTRCLTCPSDSLWAENVVEPSVTIIKSFLCNNSEATRNSSEQMKVVQRDLWTRYVCKACSNKELRGAHEWEQHKQGRSHRKRVSSLKKSGIFPKYNSEQ